MTFYQLLSLTMIHNIISTCLIFIVAFSSFFSGIFSDLTNPIITLSLFPFNCLISVSTETNVSSKPPNTLLAQAVIPSISSFSYEFEYRLDVNEVSAERVHSDDVPICQTGNHSFRYFINHSTDYLSIIHSLYF